MKLSLSDMMRQTPKTENNAQISFNAALENFREERINKSVSECKNSVQIFRQEISVLMSNQPAQAIEKSFLLGYYHTKEALHSLQNFGYINELAAERIENVLSEIRGAITGLESGVITIGEKGDVSQFDNFYNKATSQIVWLNDFFEQVVANNSVHSNSLEQTNSMIS